jgi:hypothetical protein
MHLRILRTFRWINLCSSVVGGTPVYHLKSSDTLQYQHDVGSNWRDIPVHEEEKPLHPDEIQRVNFISDILQDLRTGKL